MASATHTAERCWIHNFERSLTKCLGHRTHDAQIEHIFASLHLGQLTVRNETRVRLGDWILDVAERPSCVDLVPTP